MGRSVDPSLFRPWNAKGASRSHAAVAGAVPLAARLRHELTVAAGAVPGLESGLDPPLVLSTTVRIQRRRAIGAEDSQVLNPVVVPNAVDVIEDHRHPLAAPALALTALLAFRSLQAGLDQTLLQVAAAVGRMLNENLLQWDPSPLAQSLSAYGSTIEMGGVDSPFGRVLLDGSGIAAGRSVAEQPQGLRPATGSRNRPTKFLLGEAHTSRHTNRCSQSRMTASRLD